MEVNRDEVTQEQWDEWKQLMRDSCCAECGSDLTIKTIPEHAALHFGCPNTEHHGFIERTTYTQEFRRGEPLHPAIQSAIERKMMPRDELGRAMNLLALRYPNTIVDPPTAALFIVDCTRLALDPLISPAEAVPIPFKSKKTKQDGQVEVKVTIQMVITEDGWLSMAARGCPERWAGAPSVEPVNDKALAESLCGDPEAWLWKATGRTKDMEPGQSSMAYGYFRQAEYKKAVDNKLPAATQPGNQARIRAIKRWVRENFPECRQNMIDITADWFQRAEGIKAAQEYIDAEYAFISLPEGGEKIGGRQRKQGGVGKESATRLSPLGQETTKAESDAPAAEAEGESFSINLDWLDESLKELKWTIETAKGFLVSHYKVSPQGALTDVIERLTREQAEEFVKEIQKRVGEKQRALFD